MSTISPWPSRNMAAPLGLTGVARPALSALLNERASLSPEMALRLEKAFGVRMDTLMRMQTSHDVARACRRECEIRVERYAGGTETAARRELS